MSLRLDVVCAMTNMLAALTALNLSIAARAYWIGLQALDLGPAAANAPAFQSKTETARREMRLALTAIERLVAEMGLEWQPIPADRQLRTQVGLLRDALHHASPEALRGFGDLKPATADYLSIWTQSVTMAIETLAEAVEGTVAEVALRESWTPDIGGLDANALNRCQRPALHGFASAFAAELLLAEAQGQAALPPGHPTISSPYDGQEMARILAVACTLEAWLGALTSAFTLSVPRCASTATIVHRSMHDALECLRQLSSAASVLGDTRASALAGLSVTTSHNLMLALNLT